MCYGNIIPRNRWSSDQVPCQDRIVKKTVDFKGTKRVHIKTQKSDFARRFCTFQLTVRAENPQTMPLIIIFKGKPSDNDPSVPKSGKLKKELSQYDPRVIVLWDKIAYLKKEQARFWQDLWLILAEGYQPNHLAVCFVLVYSKLLRICDFCMNYYSKISKNR